MTIKQSYKTLEKAFEELEDAGNIKGSDEREDLRQAAEKAWRAAREAVYAVLRAGGVDLKGTLRTGSIGKFEYDAFRRERRDQVLSDGYARAKDELHGECFYDGACPPKAQLRRTLDGVRNLVEQAEADIALLERIQGRRKSRRSKA